ncbi:MAG: hypothetical protein QMC62_10605 [Alteromonadaceae bacterium]
MPEHQGHFVITPDGFMVYLPSKATRFLKASSPLLINSAVALCTLSIDF